MRKPLFLALASISPILAGAQSPDLDVRRDFVLSGQWAYGLMPPEQVSTANASEASWSSDGKFLLYSKENMPKPDDLLQGLAGHFNDVTPPDGQLLIWNASKHKSDVFLRVPAEKGRIMFSGWLPGTASVMAIVDFNAINVNGVDMPAHQQVLMYSQTTQNLKIVADFDASRYVSPNISPAKPMAILRVTAIERRNDDSDRTAFLILNSAGKVSAPIEKPSSRADLEWTLQGDPLLVKFSPPKKQGGRIQQEFFTVDIRTLKSQAIPSPVKTWAAPKPTEIMTGIDSTFVTLNEVKVPAGTITLISMREKAAYAIVAIDGKVPILSPQLDNVAYFEKGTLMVRPILRISKDAYDAAMLMAKKMEAMNNAKQAGLGLIMLANDMDDVLTGNDPGWRDRVGPYMKDSDALNGFVYTYNGGSMLNINEPANTMIGYVPGPGGKAVTYADGHVKWIKD